MELPNFTIGAKHKSATTQFSSFPVYGKADLNPIALSNKAGGLIKGSRIRDIEVIYTGPMMDNGFNYHNAVVVSFTYDVAKLDVNSGHASNIGTLTATGYGVIFSKTQGHETLWALIDDDKPASTSSSYGGNTKADDPYASEDESYQFMEVTSTDQYWTSTDLWSNGIYTDNKASELNKYLNKLGGTANVSMRLFGLPYQFMPSVDSRLPSVSSTIGVQFMRNIISEAAILTITPGQAKYLGDYAADSATKTAALIENLNVLDNITNSKDLSKHDGYKYYDFEQTYTEYMKYVNLLCRTTAAFMKLESMPVDTNIQTKLAFFDWKDYRFQGGVGYNSVSGDMFGAIGNGIKDLGAQLMSKAEEYGADAVAQASRISAAIENGKSIEEAVADEWAKVSGKHGVYDPDYPNSAASVGETMIALNSNGDEDASFLTAMGNAFLTNENFVQFMINPSSFGESSTNGTGESQLAGMVNDGLSKTMRELQFISGTVGAHDEVLTEFAADTADALLGALSDMGGGGLSGVFGRVGSILKHTVTGSRLIFPKIFSDNTYSKSYDVSIELKSPYGDRYSYYMNILVPLMHLIALTAPRQTSANTYDSPFLVQATLPGMWQCNLGIVNSLTITRSGTDGVSVDGYPLSLKIDLSIEDMYSDLMITSSEDPTLFMCNTGLVDFIMVQCGLDVTRKNYEERLNAQVTGLVDYWTDIGSNAVDAFNTFMSHNISGFIEGLLPGTGSR